MSIAVRRARPVDARAIARVQVDTFRAAYRGLLPKRYLDELDLAEVSAGWGRRLSSIRPSVLHEAAGIDVWVATIDGEVIGFTSAHPDRHAGGFGGYGAEISYLYVHPAFQHRGIGSRLVDRAFSALESRQFLWVTVSVLESNRAARSFYLRRGLRFDGTRYLDPRFEVVVVQHGKPLNPVVDFEALRASGLRPR